ncbi:T6SS effector amidase Tae4 family protein [Acinetobacter dispersus]|uniref:Uncharacterized protein n=1 Tax=Acinetobacter dispersus TaxID=70348 RepID=N9LEM2_9GAMM|nr:T6SS effector amidase Tae4 family protein [Acinetobacter dispersus]ENW94757.1 hypothetical protein F904_00728 [Acinetobacter dispersus]
MAQLTASAGNSASKIKVNRPAWNDMFSSYPKENITSSNFYPMVSQRFAQLARENPRDWENTCAARMSYALNRSGIRLPQAPAGGNLVGEDKFNYWLRVKDLKTFMFNRFKSPDISYTPIKVNAIQSAQAKERITGVQTNILQKIKGKKGIVVFDVTGWDNASGHFTLWDGVNLLYVGPSDHNVPASMEYYFWFMREMPYFDKGFKVKVVQTTKISFWELK